MSTNNQLGRCYPFLGKFKITSRFGPRNTGIAGASTDHKGVDLVSLGDWTVVAVSPGTVTEVGYNKTRGKYVWISTEDGFGTMYQHLAKTYVTTGQKVNAKTPVGYMGNTGVGSGAHLHFEVSKSPSFSETQKNRNAYYINPMVYFGTLATEYLDKKHTQLDGSGMLTAGEVQQTEYEQANNTLSQITESGEHYKIDGLTGTSYDLMYGRKYRIFVTLKSGQTLDISSLRCTFEITKSWERKEDYCMVSVYNLNANDENRIIQEGDKVTIEAGYAGEFYGQIYTGNVFQTLRAKENGTDFVLSIIAYDTYVYSLYNVTNTTIIAQSSMRQAVNAITSPINQGVITNKTNEITYPRGKVLFGVSDVLLKQIERTTDSTYYIENGQANIVSATDISNNEIFDLTPESGLVGSPSQSQQGITCQCLMNPLIKINSLFHIDNTKVRTARLSLGSYQIPLDADGIYRVIKIQYTGDTWGSDWYLNIDAITQVGTLPGLAQNSGTFIN